MFNSMCLFHITFNVVFEHFISIKSRDMPISTFCMMWVQKGSKIVFHREYFGNIYLVYIWSTYYQKPSSFVKPTIRFSLFQSIPYYIICTVLYIYCIKVQTSLKHGSRSKDFLYLSLRTLTSWGLCLSIADIRKWMKFRRGSWKGKEVDIQGWLQV